MIDKSIVAGLKDFLFRLDITPTIYHKRLPQNPTYPATVFSIISQVPIGRSHDTKKLPFKEARLQIDIYTENETDLQTAKEAYREAIGNYDGSLGIPGYGDVSIRWDNDWSDIDFMEEAVLVNVERAIIDFMILYK